MRAEMVSRADEAGRARIRVSARPSATQGLVRALEAWSGPEGLRLVVPAQGIVIGELDEDRLEPFIEHCGREDWAVFVERASLEIRARVDVFGPTPGSIDLMRALKSRFDPEGVLSPGRFIGGI